jgi:hypothetical protein
MFARSSSWTGSPEALRKWEDNAPQVRGDGRRVGRNRWHDRPRSIGRAALTMTLGDNEVAALVSD